MKYVYKEDVSRFAQFAKRVWNVDDNFFDMEEMALRESRLEKFFSSIGLPVRLKQAGIDDTRLEEMADKCTQSDTVTVGQFKS